MKKITQLMWAITLFISAFTQAQTPGDIVQSFGTAKGFNSAVFSTVVQPDGKIVVGGSFTTYKGATENRLVRLNADGTKDASFDIGTGFDAQVQTMVLLSDGKILVGGSFTSYNGVTENRIIRLNADGSKDASFATGTGFGSTVRVITLQSDGKIIVGGDFTSYNGVTESRIIRLNADGTKDASFAVGTGFNGSINAVAQQPDGKVLVGGGFFIFNGATGKNYIIRLNVDGSEDASFNVGTGFSTSTNSLVVQPDGKVLVGGQFVTYKGATENRLVRLNADGTKDTSFSTGTGFNGTVNRVALQPDGKIMVVGLFTSYQGITENRIIRLNTDGTKDASFNLGTGFNDATAQVAIQSDGKILIGGVFISYNGLSLGRIIRLNTDGSNDASFNTGLGFNNSISTTVKQPDGKVLVGGLFVTYKGLIENYIIRLNTDGTKDVSFVTGTGFNTTVRAIALQPDGKILVGGSFTTYNGLTSNSIIRLNSDGSTDTSFNVGTGFNNIVYSIVMQPDGKILVGGNFVNYNGDVSSYIIRLNTDGSKDASFNIGNGFNNTVFSVVLQPDGKMVVGGNFTSFNSVTETRIVRLNTDGSKDVSFVAGTGFNATVLTIAVQSDGKILVGGIFTSFNTVTENRIIRLNADGTKDVSFVSGTGFNNGVRAIALQPDGKVLVGGDFTGYNGITENRIIRLNADGSKEVSFVTGTGFNGPVNTIFLQSNDTVLVGGGFTTYNDDNSSAYLIGLHAPSTTLGSNDFYQKTSFVVYPNPVNDVLNLQINNVASIKNVKIFDLQGKLLLQSTNETINVSELSKGIYIIKVSTENGETTKKFIKN
ncbi:T9SS type A sorting domain-containing protein [Flavobacterium sp. HXWNR29]|uniref:T9SS type A sorting domain-containing protein n=1 Tax=Flavobacterium odoriferum TaxID=2946604 RepID=UPI0021CB4E07|nr:T9SS type A sorting domain-containing protein [Flavobacterium sp. HXWNR29]MCU4190037.1 T9SS type A sorting domain-containing protein [Flavobacterium sp. HXWNR29]